MAKTSYSGELVRVSKKSNFDDPGEQITDAVIGCGSTTGRNTEKIAKFQIKMQKLDSSAIEVPLHSRVAIQCTLI